MTPSEIETKPGAMLRPGVIGSKCALIIPDGLLKEEWASLGIQIQRCHEGVLWWIGDWLVYGQTKYGETYKDAIDLSGYDYQTVANAKWVAESVELSLRRDNLSWSHHHHVAQLTPRDQEKWLAKAEELGLTISELRASIKAGKVIRAKKIKELTGRGQAFYNPVGHAIEYQHWRKAMREHVPEWTRDEIQTVRESLQPFAEDYEYLGMMLEEKGVGGTMHPR